MNNEHQITVMSLHLETYVPVENNVEFYWHFNAVDCTGSLLSHPWFSGTSRHLIDRCIHTFKFAENLKSHHSNHTVESRCLQTRNRIKCHEMFFWSLTFQLVKPHHSGGRVWYWSIYQLDAHDLKNKGAYVSELWITHTHTHTHTQNVNRIS